MHNLSLSHQLWNKIQVACFIIKLYYDLQPGGSGTPVGSTYGGAVGASCPLRFLCPGSPICPGGPSGPRFPTHWHELAGAL